MQPDHLNFKISAANELHSQHQIKAIFDFVHAKNYPGLFLFSMCERLFEWWNQWKLYIFWRHHDCWNSAFDGNGSIVACGTLVGGGVFVGGILIGVSAFVVH